MKIVAVSDTHGTHRQVDLSNIEADTLIVAGDITNTGELSLIEDVCDWASNLQFKNKVLICGNHEVGISAGPKRKKAIKLLKNHFTYLENSFEMIDGYKFYGSPATPYFCGWEWNYNRGITIAEQWAKIPLDVDVLITHGPPYGVLDLVEDNIYNVGRDLHQGCADLTNKLMELTNLKAHVFGHLHHSHGLLKINNTIFANSAICNENYQPINPPHIFEI